MSSRSDDAAARGAARDTETLHRFGYAQQLLRDIGGFSTFALSFSIISILTGAVTLYGHGLHFGGPFVMLVGWPLVSVMTLAVAASLGELASAYPTAGALYHWASILGGPGWGFLTAWLNTIGQFAITAGIDYGLAELVVALLQWPPGRGRVLGVFAAVVVSHAAINHVGVRVVARSSAVSAWYHLGGVVLVIGAIALFAPARDIGFLATRFTDQPFPYPYAFCVGLLQACWTFTGYDASAHATEETVDPTRNAPRGMVLSVVVSAVAGYAMLLAVTMAIRDLPAAAASASPFAFVLRGALGDRLGTVVVWIVVGAMWFCGLSSVTSNSRMLFAFARDGGLPWSRHLAAVSPRHRTPHVAVWVSAGAAFVVALWADAYAAMIALSTIALYASYGVPVVLAVRVRRRGRRIERGPWHLGAWSGAVNGIAIVWLAATLVLFVLPPNALAGYTFGGALLALAVYWHAHVKRRFAGPAFARGGRGVVRDR